MPSLAAQYNFIADQGATFRRGLIKKDSYGRTVPLTGYTVRMQIRETYESPTTLFNLTVASGNITIDAARGVITITITDEEMTNVVPQEYVYDIELAYPTGEVERLLMGTFTVRNEVTR